MRIVVKSIAHDQIYSESKHPNITVGKDYLVLTIENGGDYYRILNDNNEPIIYEKEIFDIIDDRIPKNWIRKDYDDGDYSIYPQELMRYEYFFIKYFDDNEEVIETFNQYLKTLDL